MEGNLRRDMVGGTRNEAGRGVDGNTAGLADVLLELLRMPRGVTTSGMEAAKRPVLF